MNCREALDTLEAVEVGALLATETLARDAERHRAGCAACQRAWPTWQQWSHRLAEAMTDVPIPPGLSGRLLAACDAGERTVISSATTRRRSRRGVLLGAAIAVLLAVGLAWQWQPLPKVSEPDLLAAMTAELGFSPPFVGRFTPQLPEAWRRYYELNPQLIRGYPAGDDHAAQGHVALIPFHFQTGDRAPSVHGRLLILRRDQFASTATAHGFGSAAVYYTRTGGAYALWSEGNLLYVCLVPSGPADLHRVQELMTQARSVT